MNLVSYCLFSGEAARREFYFEKVPAVVRAHHNLFPGWEMWVHYDDTIPSERCGKLLAAYAKFNLVKLIPCGQSQAIALSALWRFKPLWQPGVDYMLSRDMDSLPVPKDRRAVEVFLQSGKVAHSITDHPQHRVAGDGGFMAGMCGFNAARTLEATSIASWDSFVARGERLDIWSGGPDQQLLYNALYLPLAHANAICRHDLTRPSAVALPLADVNQCVQDGGDVLTPFMGCPGFDVGQAIRFYDNYGNPDVADTVAGAEALV
jgi:hypothetical protein